MFTKRESSNNIQILATSKQELIPSSRNI